ncbi:helix-turn-helix domain-containing protein [Cytophagaceae bacterium YF14B1]|uniref:Helix-turn-helix domain-containing protein n=1 Tax=Xanthocytophaga flava TaxID=3048013 RepID=A0AAE3QTV9_9BACT|nr:helix-turn-helix domain-containing protein [Xanthocytophaga flavus]MDJ1483130.1 helix-turn-helix domain-containing protein [Xanthocytophaga flavus]
MDELLTYDQVAELLKVKKTTVKNWASLGKIPKTGIRGRFSRKAIEAWIEMQHVPSAIEIMKENLRNFKRK